MDYILEKAFIDDNQNEQRKEIAAICQQSPMFDCITRRVAKRQLEDINGHLLYDFATQDYLGLDFNKEVINAALEATKQFGTVVAWCRLVATLELFNQTEQSIADLIGTQACSIFASTTLLNHGVIPALLGRNGLMLLDKKGHMTMYEAAKIARDSGSKLLSFPSNDMLALETILKENQNHPKKLICVDGVNSMTGEYTNLPELDKLAKQYNALIYVDDAHGFGVVGEKPSKEHPYGQKGNGLARYYNLDYNNILYIGCFSKAYGSFGAFIGCSKKMRNFLISQATPHDLGGAGPASAMAALLAGLKINEQQGIVIRQRIWVLTQKTLIGLQELGYSTYNTTGFPIISVKLEQGCDIIAASKILYKNHILLTMAPYPMVKKGDEAFRITITASNTEQEIAQLITAFSELKYLLLR